MGSSSIREKIQQRFNTLELMLSNQQHLEDQDSAINLVLSITKFYSALKEDEREYIDCAKNAIIGQFEWK